MTALAALTAVVLPVRAGGEVVPCPADITGDGAVDSADLTVVLADWGQCSQGGSKGCLADFDGDGAISGVDLHFLLTSWGPCISVPSWAEVIEAVPNPDVVTNGVIRERILATGLAWRVRDTATQIEMLLIPPGAFQMGEVGWATPVHEVTLTNAYYMGRYEVTQAQWQARMGSNPSEFTGFTDSPSRPVERVSWNTIQGFLNATGMRLPTEAEWEYACRAGTTTAFHGWPANPSGTNDDNQVGNIAWFIANAGSQTRPVGGKAANGFGLHDMSGNAWEWVNDWYGSYSADAQTNPQGPSSGSSRVLRGGSCFNLTTYERSSYRGNSTPDDLFNDFGFRVSRTPYDPPTLTAVAPASGSVGGGTLITLTGTNLLGASSVTVGGVAASSVQVVNATTVTALTPAGTAGAASVAVTTPHGTATLSNAFTYIAATVPAWATLIEAAPDPAVIYDEAQRAAIIATGLAWRVRDTATQIEMLLIPPGAFQMGEVGWATPVHQVTLTNAFYLGRYEVTQAQWQATMGSNPSYFVAANGYPNSDSRPVEQVSWNTIQGFLSATGMRLPTEAEWEYACRAGTTTAYHGWPANPSGTNDNNQVGNIAWDGANSCEPSKEGPINCATQPVGMLRANGFGLHDMSGNVWEWVKDWHGSYSADSQTNPQGPSSGSHRVRRGGSWVSDTDYVRSSYRSDYTPGSSNGNIGFRVSRTP